MFIPLLIIIPTQITSIYILIILQSVQLIFFHLVFFLCSKISLIFFWKDFLQSFWSQSHSTYQYTLKTFQGSPYFQGYPLPFTFSFFESYCTLNIKELHMQITVVGRQQGVGREVLGKCEGELSNKLCMPLNLHFSVEFFLFLFFYINLLLY